MKKGGVITEASDRRVGHPATRGRVIELLAQGPATAAALGVELGLSPAGVRRHLDAMYAEGLVSAREQVIRGPRGRGRPAKVFSLTDTARDGLGRHAYDGLATAALRWIAERGGEREVAAFAAAQISVLEQRCEAAVRDSGDDPLARAEALAEALTAQGYAASASTIATGGQLCQHHCPVAHVAAEFPQLCEAETEVIGRLVGTHVQRLATIAHGDGVCTTHIPPKLARPGAPPGGAPAPAGRTELIQINDGVTMRTGS
ncbi:helix-turn-helix transcriptional regulator [Catellatospora vulcania]|uniref:helix-turn-helix transcriptional regulator n=1 Tax=Catellatospora vulcania TaxID=1460450 RepID=UPI001E5E332D|nr:ArsR family transcriptional regulator [Catellatospora vulcania]